LGSSHADHKKFDSDARSEAGYQLDKVQNGGEPSDWKPMNNVALGVKEIRIHTSTENRVIYVAKFAEGFTYCTRSPRKPSKQISAISI
jgi:phage-related protein